MIFLPVVIVALIVSAAFAPVSLDLRLALKTFVLPLLSPAKLDVPSDYSALTPSLIPSQSLLLVDATSKHPYPAVSPSSKNRIVHSTISSLPVKASVQNPELVLAVFGCSVVVFFVILFMAYRAGSSYALRQNEKLKHANNKAREMTITITGSSRPFDVVPPHRFEVTRPVSDASCSRTNDGMQASVYATLNTVSPASGSTTTAKDGAQGSKYTGVRPYDKQHSTPSGNSCHVITVTSPKVEEEPVPSTDYKGKGKSSTAQGISCVSKPALLPISTPSPVRVNIATVDRHALPTPPSSPRLQQTAQPDIPSIQQLLERLPDATSRTRNICSSIYATPGPSNIAAGSRHVHGERPAEVNAVSSSLRVGDFTAQFARASRAEHPDPILSAVTTVVAQPSSIQLSPVRPSPVRPMPPNQPSSPTWPSIAQPSFHQPLSSERSPSAPSDNEQPPVELSISSPSEPFANESSSSEPPFNEPSPGGPCSSEPSFNEPTFNEPAQNESTSFRPTPISTGLTPQAIYTPSQQTPIRATFELDTVEAASVPNAEPRLPELERASAPIDDDQGPTANNFSTMLIAPASSESASDAEPLTDRGQEDISSQDANATVADVSFSTFSLPQGCTDSTDAVTIPVVERTIAEAAPARIHTPEVSTVPTIEIAGESTEELPSPEASAASGEVSLSVSSPPEITIELPSPEVCASSEEDNSLGVSVSEVETADSTPPNLSVELPASTLTLPSVSSCSSSTQYPSPEASNVVADSFVPSSDVGDVATIHHDREGETSTMQDAGFPRPLGLAASMHAPSASNEAKDHAACVPPSPSEVPTPSLPRPIPSADPVTSAGRETQGVAASMWAPANRSPSPSIDEASTARNNHHSSVGMTPEPTKDEGGGKDAEGIAASIWAPGNRPAQTSSRKDKKRSTITSNVHAPTTTKDEKAGWGTGYSTEASARETTVSSSAASKSNNTSTHTQTSSEQHIHRPDESVISSPPTDTPDWANAPSTIPAAHIDSTNVRKPVAVSSSLPTDAPQTILLAEPDCPEASSNIHAGGELGEANAPSTSSATVSTSSTPDWAKAPNPAAASTEPSVPSSDAPDWANAPPTKHSTAAPDWANAPPTKSAASSSSVPDWANAPSEKPSTKPSHTRKQQCSKKSTVRVGKR
ncbi:hypothetical protein OF83DRAFT_1171539 [Amylostereum chailletii]|nr:hypothetical protein OF83DRAFT_1171539 [Amylostereum chailletii]